MADFFDLDLFKQRLAETIAWCVPRFTMDNIKDSLRTPPNYPKEILHVRDYDDIKEFADIVFAKRANAVSVDPIRNIQESLAGGRLLFMHLIRATCDGTSPCESYDFIDDWDFTPWDTWIYFDEAKDRVYKNPTRNHYLISWIPPEMLQLVDMAVQTNATECIQWIEDVWPSYDFLDLLRN